VLGPGHRRAGEALKSATVLFLAAVLLAGCGGNQSKKPMNAKFARLDYALSSVEISAPPYQENLTKLTQQYIALVREYADDLGDDEVRRRLTDKASERDPFCLPCSGMVSDERAKH
jgi:hypothetical protein